MWASTCSVTFIRTDHPQYIILIFNPVPKKNYEICGLGRLAACPGGGPYALDALSQGIFIGGKRKSHVALAALAENATGNDSDLVFPRQKLTEIP
jgi:hypothetical protein